MSDSRGRGRGIIGPPPELGMPGSDNAGPAEGAVGGPGASK